MTGPATIQYESPKIDPGQIRLEPSWKNVLLGEFAKPYMLDLKQFLRTRYQNGAQIYPKPSDYFQALDHCPLDRVKVVLLGQDPYHGPGQAHGLCFSVPTTCEIPPSLRNIFQELHSDLGIPPPKTGCLLSWAKQGVLLLNAVLTVESGVAGAHQNKGWELFTDKIVSILAQQQRPLAFVLWGAYAQKKAQFVASQKHLILKAPHPSPLSAHRGFFGSKPFSKINQFLKETGQEPIDWRLSDLQN